jgi:transcriptional regulator with XRE-family HTH domain
MTIEPDVTVSGNNPVAEILEALMSKHSLNQTELANKSGVSQPAINRILKERTKAKKPRRETLEKIGTALGVTPEQLTGQEPISVRLFDKGAVPLGRWETLTHTPHPADAPRGGALICPVPHSEMSFALPVIGEAMAAEDGYREGEVIFVDSTVEPTHGRDVVAVSPKAAQAPDEAAVSASHRLVMAPRYHWGGYAPRSPPMHSASNQHAPFRADTPMSAWSYRETSPYRRSTGSGHRATAPRSSHTPDLLETISSSFSLHREMPESPKVPLKFPPAHVAVVRVQQEAGRKQPYAGISSAIPGTIAGKFRRRPNSSASE